MVALLFVLVALGSLANSVEMRDHDRQLQKVSASLRRVLTATSGCSQDALDADCNPLRVGRPPAGFKLDFVGEEGMLAEGFRPTNGFGFKLDFVGEEGMLAAGFRPTDGFVFEEADDVNADAFDEGDIAAFDGSFAGFSSFNAWLRAVNDWLARVGPNFDWTDFGNRNAIRDGLVGDDPEEPSADFIATGDPNLDFGDFGYVGMASVETSGAAQRDSAYDCVWTVGDGIGGSEEKISETLTERECMLACRSDGRFNGATINANGQGGCWCEAGMTDIDSSATAYETCQFDVDWILLRSDVECGNNENEVDLGTFADVDACAEACRNRDGCTNFIYGKGEKAGRCWDEAISESACTTWEDDQYDFYGLPGTETVVTLPAF